MKYNFLITLQLLVCQSIISMLFAQQLDTIALPNPDKTSGKPLMAALQERHSSRQFSNKELSTAQLSNLLWAANGINRPESGKRTAPTARNYQDMDVFVFMAQGVYKYDAIRHVLVLLQKEDHRKATGMQDFVQNAALNLVLVSDLSKMKDTPDEARVLYAGVHAGCIVQNVYLWCASEGLNTVTRASFDATSLAKLLNLSGSQKVVMAQTVGFKP
jgi:SagB-type dehydrogenase family enzyme